MDKDLNLTVYNNRGYPPKEETLKTDAETKAEIIKLQQQMNYKSGTEILLATSVATDEMLCHTGFQRCFT